MYRARVWYQTVPAEPGTWSFEPCVCLLVLDASGEHDLRTNLDATKARTKLTSKQRQHLITGVMSAKGNRSHDHLFDQRQIAVHVRHVDRRERSAPRSKHTLQVNPSKGSPASRDMA